MKNSKRCLLLLLALIVISCIFASCKKDDIDKEPDEDDNAYHFTVVYEDTNEPAVGVMVQLCSGDLCIMPIASDSNGKVVYDLGTNGYGIYEIHVMDNTIPEGYTFDNAEFQTNESEHSYTLVLKKKCNHTFVNDICQNCGAAKTYTHTVKAFYSDTVKDTEKRGQPIANVTVIVNDGSKLIAQGTTDNNGEFSFEAVKYISSNEITSYEVAVSGAPDGYKATDRYSFIVTNFICEIEFYDVVVPDPYIAFNPQKIKIGNTVHFSLSEARTDNANTVYDDSLFYFSVTPTKKTDVGYYEITISNIPKDITLFVAHCPSSIAYVSRPSETTNATGTDTITLNFIIEEKYLKDSNGDWVFSNSWLFGIRVESDTTYPLEFDVSVKKTRELIAGVDYVIRTEIKPTVAEGTPKADDVLGNTTSGKTLTAISEENAADTVIVLGDDGYYHMGTKNGAILMLDLKNHNPIFGTYDEKDEEATEISFLTINSISAVENLAYYKSWTEDGKNYIEVFYNYTMLSQYGELCNSDGAYMVNEQLYTFLVNWVGYRILSQNLSTALSAEQALLIACSYYC